MLAWTAAAALGLLLFGALGSLVNYYTNPIYSKTRGWRELAATLDRYSAGLPADKVRLVQNYPDPTLWYYYNGPVGHLVLPPAANDEARTAQEVAALAAGDVQRVVMPLQPEDWWDGAGIAQRALAEQYTLVATTQVAGWPVEVYTRPPANLQPVDTTFITPGRAEDAANGIRLAAISVPKQELIPGDVLDVYLAWEGEAQVLTGSEKMTLQLLDGAGRLVAQTDQPLNASDLGAPSTAYVLSIPWQLPPGDYRLIAALYDPAQPGAPRLLTESGADHVELAVLPQVNR